MRREEEAQPHRTIRRVAKETAAIGTAPVSIEQVNEQFGARATTI
jgi:hypothetical protein